MINLSYALLPELVQAGAGGGVPLPTSQTSSTVVMQNSQFLPQTIHIISGTTVIWVNQDAISHTTISDNRSMAEAWDSGTLTQGQSFSKTFTQPGIYTYHCSFHPNMRGTIQVVAAQATPSPVPTFIPAPTPVPIPNQLPATGPPFGTYLLMGLIPFGVILTRFKKESKEKESVQTLWEKRHFKSQL